MSILKNQNRIIEAIKHFGCDKNNLDMNEMAFDLCAFYMAQIEPNNNSKKWLTPVLSCVKIQKVMK